MRKYLIPLMLLLVSLGFGQQDFSKVQIKTTHVAGNVYMLVGAGGNIGVSVGPDGILIVDDQFAPLADKIRAALHHLNSGKLKFILNTHWHGDHTGGNKVFSTETPILAHTNVRKRLMEGVKRGNRTMPPAPKEAWPVITFDDSVPVHFNNEEIKAIPFPPRHTDGDVIVFFTKSNVVHMGDDFFSGGFPFVDLASGGDVEGLIQTIEKVLKKLPEDVKLIPGHGPLSGKKELREYLTMLKETTAIVRAEMKQGLSLKEIQKKGLPEKWKSWSWRFIDTDRWLQIVFNSLKKHA